MPDEYARVRLKGIIDDVEFAQGVEEKFKQRRAALATQSGANDVRDTGMGTLNRMLGALNLNVDANKNIDDKEKAQMQKFLGEQFGKISDVMTKGVGMAFDVVEDIYKEMKRNSPLLQTLESLFNLAMQLFFMPLGNKLAEVLLPAVIELVETAAKMWDELGDGNLSQIFSYAIQYGINALAKFFTTIGEELKSQGGVFASIGNMLIMLGNFIKGPAFSILETILDAVEFVLEHLKEIISAIIAFKIASLTMDILTAKAIITGHTTAMGTSVGTAAGLALLAGGGAMIGMGALGFADGGMVKHTPGGQLITVAEHEDEYIVPRSKANMGGNVINNFYGYTSRDIEEKIDRSVSEKVSISRIKGSL